MALQGSGTISISDIALHKGAALSNVGLTSLSVDNVNQNSVTRPDGIASHYMSEFYGYDHNASAGGGDWWNYMSSYATAYQGDPCDMILVDIYTDNNTGQFFVYNPQMSIEPEPMTFFDIYYIYLWDTYYDMYRLDKGNNTLFVYVGQAQSCHPFA
jgi:hypothetical protein